MRKPPGGRVNAGALATGAAGSLHCPKACVHECPHARCIHSTRCCAAPRTRSQYPGECAVHGHRGGSRGTPRVTCHRGAALPRRFCHARFIIPRRLAPLARQRRVRASPTSGGSGSPCTDAPCGQSDTRPAASGSSGTPHRARDGPAAGLLRHADRLAHETLTRVEQVRRPGPACRKSTSAPMAPGRTASARDSSRVVPTRDIRYGASTRGLLTCEWIASGLPSLSLKAAIHSSVPSGWRWIRWGAPRNSTPRFTSSAWAEWISVTLK